MSEIKMVRVTKDYDGLDKIKEIYEEAFPLNEREASVDQFLSVSEKTGGDIAILAAEEDGKPVGFMIFSEEDDYVYGFFLAIDSSLRGLGYGSKIFKSFIDKYDDRLVIFEIETPLEQAENYNQRVKRKAFYDRLGCVDPGLRFYYGDDNYMIMANRNSEKISDCFKHHILSCLELIKLYSKNPVLPSEEELNEFLKQIEA